MDCRPFEITLFGANDIKDVNTFSKMDVYAVVSVAGAAVKKQKLRTPVHKDGGTNPKWNHTLKFTLDDAALLSDRLKIKIKLISDRTVGDTVIGKAVIPAKDLMQSEKANHEKPVTYPIVTPKGRTKGSVSFGYKFGEKFSAPIQAQPQVQKKAHEPVMAYPAGHAGSSSVYPPPGVTQPVYHPYPPQPQPGYGYPPQQQPGYGYGPPPQAGYGYPPVVQPGYGYAQKPKRGGGNMALGLGAGLLGGLLIGDMVSDVGEMGAYDAGCDDGFGDGFDF
ncbi:protein SRC2 [Argentina anserina]|uniref:protein SRC2 n=1 Tax=Argentina anserina TaxID=57926 RepID=UPI0021763755|nr:protein SRC2 [Potentilla anserina]